MLILAPKTSPLVFLSSYASLILAGNAVSTLTIDTLLASIELDNVSSAASRASVSAFNAAKTASSSASLSAFSVSTAPES